ncbi:hypothetical protein [Bremerella alba]|uniref:Transmembrane protein n=1 Tax=Bremerella alba TaxID=980252 RepID=A0A7V8V266_9BACT|nr:hypothetical protein [Bremerella alba]MBA2113441.1 hypothetical protein [Bremerella alba]
MNLLPKVVAHWKWPSRWQWLVLTWLVALNATPYVIVALTSGSFSILHWVIWTMLSSPFALIGMFSFLSVAGGWPVMARRLTGVTGSLLVIGLLMFLLNEEAVGVSAWLLLEAVVIVVMTLLSCRFFGIPARPNRWSLQFSLAEIILLSGLAGVFLFMLRLADATDLQFWKQAQEMIFVIFAFVSGVYLVPICLSTVATSRRAVTWWIVSCLALWAVVPLIFLAALMPFESWSGNLALILAVLYPVLGVQALMVWGTLFPIRIFFPNVLFAKEDSPATAVQDKSDTLADAPASYPHSEHTDVPD